MSFNPHLQDTSELTAILEVAGRLVWDGADEMRFLTAVRQAIESFAPNMIPGAPGAQERRALGRGLAYALWDAMPQRALNWRRPPARKRGPNDPCLCGSGNKSKKCCGDTLPPRGMFGNFNTLRYVLDAVAESKLSGVDALSMPVDAVDDTARQWMIENREARVAALLAPMFDNLSKVDARHTSLFEHLMLAWLEMRQPKKRLQLLDSIQRHPDHALASSAFQFRTMIAADSGRWEEAWAMFEAARSAKLEEPALALLEVTLLLGQGRDATARAQWWADRLVGASRDHAGLAGHLLTLAGSGLENFDMSDDDDPDSPYPGPDDDLPTHPSNLPGAGNALFEAMHSQQFETIEDAQSFADTFLAQQNSRPVAEFAGLSPAQMRLLLHDPFGCPHVVQFADAIDCAGDAPVIKWYTGLARALGEHGVKRTATGNLPRALCRELALQVWGPEEYEQQLEFIKISSETDVEELHTTRVIAGLAGLIRPHKGRLVLTRLGQRSLTGKGQLEIYPRLLKAYALKFNWAYHDRYPPLRIVQNSFAFTLRLLLQHANEPARQDVDYGHDFLAAFPIAVEECEEIEWQTSNDTAQRCYEVRSLWRFASLFGLIKAAPDWPFLARPTPVEVLPLIQSVLQFR